MKTPEAIRKVVDQKDYALGNRIVDYLRFRIGMNYAQVRDAFQKHTSVTDAEFEDLMQEIEAHETL